MRQAAAIMQAQHKPIVRRLAVLLIRERPKAIIRRPARRTLEQAKPITRQPRHRTLAQAKAITRQPRLRMRERGKAIIRRAAHRMQPHLRMQPQPLVRRASLLTEPLRAVGVQGRRRIAHQQRITANRPDALEGGPFDRPAL